MEISTGRAIRMAIFGLAGLIFAACGPEKTVQWSPDGKQAAVMSQGRLYSCDDQGNLSRPLAEDVERVAWLPDSRRLVVVSKREIESWPELVATAPLGFDETKIIAAALSARDELMAFSGDLDDFKPSNSGSLTMEQWTAAMFYLKFQTDPGFAARLGDDWKEVANMKIEVRVVTLMEVNPVAARPEELLFATLSEIDELRPAPDGNVFAFVAQRRDGWMGEEVSSLSIFPIGGDGQLRLVADRVSRYPDWSPDGRGLVYFQYEESPLGHDELGRLALRTVRNGEGAILNELPDSRELAVVIFRGSLRARALPDGRIVFSGADVALPALSRDMPKELSLFILDPASPGAIRRVSNRSEESQLPDRADLFELSPDGKYASIPGSHGRVSVMELATGRLTAVVDKDSAGELITVPVWRNSDQLCLLVPAGSAFGAAGREEVVLWSQTGNVVLSGSWPDDVMAGIKQAK